MVAQFEPIITPGPPFPFLFPFFLGLLPLLAILVGLLVIVVFVVAGIADESRGQDGRRGRWLPLVYYYLATLVGLTLLLTGLIGGLGGLVTAALPSASDPFLYEVPPPPPPFEGGPIEESPEDTAEREADALDRARRSGFAGAIRGGATAAVAFPVFFWHLRQARRKEPEWLAP